MQHIRAWSQLVHMRHVYSSGQQAGTQFSSVQSLSRVQLFATPWITARQASLSITNSRSSLRFTSIESVMPSSHLILCRPLLLLPPIPPSISLFHQLLLKAVSCLWMNSESRLSVHIVVVNDSKPFQEILFFSRVFSLLSCCWTQVWLPVTQESNTEREVLGKRKERFIEDVSNPGKKVHSCPKEPTPPVLFWDYLGKRRRGYVLGKR